MAKTRVRVPKYPPKPHRSGQARIKIKGKDVYLGVHGSEASWKQYYTVISELAAGRTPGDRKTHQVERVVTVAQLIAEFLQWAKNRYVKNGKPTSQFRLFKVAAAPVVKTFAGLPADQFTSAKLILIRQSFVDANMVRADVNRFISLIRQMWKWGVPRELVKIETVANLGTLEPLKKGEAKRESTRIRPVPLGNVYAIKDDVPPSVWGMIQFQLWTGCRPGEARSARVCDIVSAEDAGLPKSCTEMLAYQPESHKTDHRGKARIILLGPDAEKLVQSASKGKQQSEYLFPTRDGGMYHSGTYLNAVASGCRRASKRAAKCEPKKPGVKTWHPNQLRHTAATIIRKEYGAEIARIILGHANLSTTEIYAEIDWEKAAEAVRKLG